MDVLSEAYPTVPLSSKSNLARQHTFNFFLYFSQFYMQNAIYLHFLMTYDIIHMPWAVLTQKKLYEISNKCKNEDVNFIFRWLASEHQDPVSPICSGMKAIAEQRWNSWTAFLVEVSGHKLESSLNWVFVWFSTLIFPFYKMLFMNRLKFYFFADFW